MLFKALLYPMALLATFVQAAYHSNAKNNLVIYWGQGADQKPLRYFCEKGNADIMVLAFINVLTSTSVGFNFGNACWGAQCPVIAEDIKYCQSQGIKVLLSIGGDRTMGNYGLNSDSDGEKAAQLLYDMFNPKGNSKVTKVFGDVEVDGFDLDVENHNQNGQIALFKKLRSLWTSKTLLLSACPQCYYPDPNVYDVMIDKDVNLDFMFMQFYSNTGCSMVEPKFDSSWDTWINFIENTSKAENLKMFVTLQASSSNKWHANLSYVNSQMSDKKTSKHFLGFGAWDATVGTDCIDKTLGESMTYLDGLKRIATNKYDSLVKRDEL